MSSSLQIAEYINVNGKRINLSNVDTYELKRLGEPRGNFIEFLFQSGESERVTYKDIKKAERDIQKIDKVLGSISIQGDIEEQYKQRYKELESLFKHRYQQAKQQYQKNFNQDNQEG